MLILIFLVGPITFIMNTFQTLSRGKVSYQMLQSLKMLNEAEPEPKAKSKVESAAPVEQKSWKVLKSNAVCYRYKSGDDFEFSIGPVELQINRGEIFFIRGGNGSGKSTFAKVLVGLYRPQEGNISLDDTPITSENLQWYRNHFATVFSDFYLFEHILDSNGELVVADKVKDQLKTLKLDDKVTIKDGKLSTTRLSQGQKKRLAMLLAYAEDAAIYVFDEWAAAHAPTFREYFYTELLPELKSKGKTVVAITHDDKYFHLADRLCTFDMGVAEVE
ncbi:MAG: ATP-binding cassette domain-containing protein [Psychrosphaera sp.]|nr:ATP-binding cassette domain-containing protein [Psychrosphaera sp.]